MSTAKCPKFSDVEGKDQQVYDELYKFVTWLAWGSQDPDNVMLEYDELVSELLEELSKGLKAYGYLPVGQLKAVIRKMMDNRIFELRYRYTKTHRVLGRMSVSLDISYGEEDSDALYELVSSDDSPEVVSESWDRILDTRNSLSERATKVFDAIVFGNDRLIMSLSVSSARAKTVYKNPKIRIKSHHLADALCMSERQVRSAMREISKVYQGVCNECQ